MAEFDYIWKELSSDKIDYSESRVYELLRLTGLSRDYFNGKEALDAGCGNGRYTYAMQQLGAHVDSIDISSEAIKQCQNINPNAKQMSLFDLRGEKLYDFVLCWGVLHHTPNPHNGFMILTEQLKRGGILHVMIYNRRAQKRYKKWRKKFKKLNDEQKLDLCKRLDHGQGNVRGWYDALSPKFNHSYSPNQIIQWYQDAGFHDIHVADTHNININGTL